MTSSAAARRFCTVRIRDGMQTSGHSLNMLELQGHPAFNLVNLGAGYITKNPANAAVTY